MAATAEQIARVRRMAAEPTANTYTDADIQGYIEAYPLLDERGQAPYTWNTATEPPAQDANEDWIPTYDLHAAAADIWDEKAALLASRFDFSADGGNYSRSQEYEQAMKQARYHRSRRSSKTMTMHVWPGRDDSTPWIGNQPEED